MEKIGEKKFSFSITPVQETDDQFEFSNCVTPNSPNSPADHLFLNGKLLPHFFPSQTTNYSYTFSRSTSRTSSVCSKDSVFSSRSNSTNSSRSSTSTDQASDRRFLSHNPDQKAKVNVIKNPVGKRPVLVQQCYGSSQRWQFIAPAPDFKRQASSARGRKPAQKKKAKKKQRGVRLRSWFGFRVFRAFMSACRECHAIDPSPRKR